MERKTVHICKDKSEISLKSSELIRELSNEAIKTRGQFTVAFSGGSLPSIVAPSLLAAKDIEWSKVSKDALHALRRNGITMGWGIFFSFLGSLLSPGPKLSMVNVHTSDSTSNTKLVFPNCGKKRLTSVLHGFQPLITFEAVGSARPL